MNKTMFAVGALLAGFAVNADELLPTGYGNPENDITSGSIEGLTWSGAARAYTIGNEVVLVFTNTTANACSFEIAPNYGGKGRALLVAGGGAGGYSGEWKLIGAGGGAGGLIETNLDFSSGSYAVTVGAGGEPKGNKDSGTNENPNGNGSDSVLVANAADLFRAIGGGAGGIPNGNGRKNLSTGRNGGSGGGGSRKWTSRTGSVHARSPIVGARP